MINLACRKLGLANYTYHGIKREYYLFSFPKLKASYHRQEYAKWKTMSLMIICILRERWLMNRAISTTHWREFNTEAYIDNVLNSLEEVNNNE